MSFSSLLTWLKPHEQIFFDLLEASIANAVEASRWFDQELRTGDSSRWKALRQKMKDYEHQGDEITHELLDRLDHTFVTPIEREDILALAHALDDVVDDLDRIADRLVIYRVQAIRLPFLEISSVVLEGCVELKSLVGSLRNMGDVAGARRRILVVNELENRADAIYHVGLGELYQDGLDAVELIKWKELLDTLETAMDRIDRAAKVVGSTIMKNS